MNHSPACMLIVLIMAAADLAAAEVCPFADAMEREHIELIERAGIRAEANLNELNKLRMLADKVPTDSNRPLVELLSGQDAARVAQILERTNLGNLINMIESARERDLDVLDNMLDTAGQLYLGRSLEEAAREEPARMLLAMMRMTFPYPDFTVDEDRVPQDCTVEAALTRRELESLPRADAVLRDVEAVTQQMQALRLKYRITSDQEIEPEKISHDDRPMFERLSSKVQAIRREQEFLADLENIRAWNAVSELIHRLRKDDLASYGPNIDAIGKTYSTQEEHLDQRTRTMVGFWNLINERIPSRWLQDMEAIQEDQGPMQ